LNFKLDDMLEVVYFLLGYIDLKKLYKMLDFA